MPFISRHELFQNQVIVGVWKITESLSELDSYIKLSNVDQERFFLRKKEKHQKSFLASRVLLQQMGIDLDDLSYKNQTIPILKSGQNISISHTHDYVAISLSIKHQIGIDIEKHHSRIIKLAYKFIHSNDDTSTPSLDSITHLTRLWVAKEAIYKAVKKDGVSFKNQMTIHYKNQSGIGKFFFEEHQILFDLYFEEINDYSLCVCMRK